MLPTPSCLPWSPITSLSAPLTLDMLVTVSGTPIPCNKSALCSSSGYFSTQLSLLPPPSTHLPSTSTPTSLNLPTVPADIFRTLLACMYTGTLDCTTDTVYQLFWYAQMLQIPAAILQCTQFLSTKLNSTTTPPASTPPPPPSPELVKPVVVKPIARQGVPLLSLTSTFGPSFLRPHLASFYSDWFLRYSTLTRNNTDNSEPGTSRQTTNQQSKENQGTHKKTIVF